MIAALFTTNAAVTIHDITKSLDLSLGVTNLFDERGGDPSSEEHRQSSIPHDPRTVWLRLSVGLTP
jgi:outer membrane receptor for monomeric catechols